jgi:hypothetical protein
MGRIYQIYGLTSEEYIEKINSIFKFGEKELKTESEQKEFDDMIIALRDFASLKIHFECVKEEKQTVPEMLKQLAEIYSERNKMYGNNYKEFGEWAAKLFPNGLLLVSADDWNRFGVMIQIMSKFSRYAQNFQNVLKKEQMKTMIDSIDDLAVYTMMLQELDADCRRENDV